MPSSQTEKAASPIVGNAIAYFVVIWIAQEGILPLEDRVEAIAMGGAIITWALLQLGAVGRFLGRLANRLLNGPPPAP